MRCYNRYTATLILPLQHVLALVFTRQHCAEPFRGLGCELFNHRRRGRILPATAPVAAGSDAGRQGGNRDAAGRELDGVAVSCTRECSTARYIHLCLGAFCFRVCSCICDYMHRFSFVSRVSCAYTDLLSFSARVRIFVACGNWARYFPRADGGLSNTRLRAHLHPAKYSGAGQWRECISCVLSLYFTIIACFAHDLHIYMHTAGVSLLTHPSLVLLIHCTCALYLHVEAPSLTSLS